MRGQLTECGGTSDPFSVVSLFAGAGGLDMGFERQGFKILWANDIDKDACETHRGWSSAEVVQGDIASIDTDTIPDSGIIIGGFPCQGFSLAGPRKIDDERNALYKFFVNLVEEKKPYVFVAENVKGILTLGEGMILEAILQDFSDRGYDVFPHLVNAADYGVPQERWRVIMMGFRKDLGIKNYEFPMPLYVKLHMEDALNGIPEPDPADVCQGSYSSRYMSRNRRRDWGDASYTIPAMSKQVPLHPSSPNMVKINSEQWAFGKDGKTRRLSWQEAAAIQTFPGGMHFSGNLTSKYRQIGNAVPVRLAEVVAIEVRRCLEGSLIYKERAPNLMADQTRNGKAFEYACLQSIKDRLGVTQEIKVEVSEAYSKAKEFYFSLNQEERSKMDHAADAAIRRISRLEPRLRCPSLTSPLTLSIQPDNKGQKGDVRDILCIRKEDEWEIGISCKHNHFALKHPRLSATIDFGKQWFGKPCSEDYFKEVAPLFDELERMRGEGKKWEDLDGKEERFYAPLLGSFKKELERLYGLYPKEIASKLVKYLIGNEDFYKVTSDRKSRTTKIQAFNFNNTLNKPLGSIRPESRVDQVSLPTEIIKISPRGGHENNTLLVHCNNGWAISLRIHSASKDVEPSLKFDVKFEGLPQALGTMTEPW